MTWINSADIDYLAQLHSNRGDNLGAAVRILAALRDDVNANSDGWHSWPVPTRAARKLMALVQPLLAAGWGYSGYGIHAADLRKAIAPIRAFYIRAHRGDYGGPFPAKNSQLEY